LWAGPFHVLVSVPAPFLLLIFVGLAALTALASAEPLHNVRLRRTLANMARRA
jgi:hypothetical protein